MTTFNVIMPCGTEKEKPSKSKAEEGAQLHVDLCDACGDPDAAVIEPVNVEADGGPTVVSDVPPEAHDQPEPEPVQADEYDLPENGPSVSEDPLAWMPGEFTDEIEGSVAISRKGYSVLAHHYGIEVESTVMVGPNETDFEYAQCHATATTDEGRRYRAHGSAHVDRGDDSFLLVEMADTRATKRALALATGVGTVAIEGLQNEL